MPAQPENANGDDMINTPEYNDINNTPQHVVNNDAEANNLNEPNFYQHWLNKLSQADSWESFEITLNDFTVAALEKARLHNNYNINSNRPRPQPRPNNVPPRAINRRPQHFFDAREASRIQRLYTMARKRAFRHITKENDIKYDGGKGRAEAFFKEIHSGKNIYLNQLNELLHQYVPKAHNNDIFIHPINNKEVINRLNKMSNTSPGTDKLEYKHLKIIDNTGRILSYIFNKCRQEQRIPNLWKCAHTVLNYKKGDNNDPSNFRPTALQPCMYKSFL